MELQTHTPSITGLRSLYFRSSRKTDGPTLDQCHGNSSSAQNKQYHARLTLRRRSLSARGLHPPDTVCHDPSLLFTLSRAL